MSEVITGHFRRTTRRRRIDWAVVGIFSSGLLIMGFAIKGIVDVVSSF